MMDKEARRDFFLVTLTHCEVRGTAEAFNVGAKTDILIRFEGRSLFIAECKLREGDPDRHAHAERRRRSGLSESVRLVERIRNGQLISQEFGICEGS
jgi:hypothetical protein